MLLFLLALGAVAASITGVEYLDVDVSVASAKFKGTLFVAHLSHGVSVNGVAVSDLSLEIPPRAMLLDTPAASGNTGQEMPPAMLQQMGLTELRCGNGQLVYPSMPAQQQQHEQGPPRFFIPLPAVEESAAVLFSIFGNSLNASAVVKKPNTLIGFKIRSNYDEASHQWESYVPGSFDPASCRVVYLNSSSISPLATRYEPACELEALDRVLTSMRLAMDRLDTVQRRQPGPLHRTS
jgi:hypothetical protein